MSTVVTRYMEVVFLIGKVPLTRKTDIEKMNVKDAVAKELDKIVAQFGIPPRIISITFYEKEEGGAGDYFGGVYPWQE